MPSLCTLGFSILALGASANAQWSSDPAVNLPVATSSGTQAQPKVAAAPDGGFYVSWLDGIGNGFDVRLQKLDADGNELWAPNGILVADRGYSSTHDYGLDVDAAGHALLAFRDDRLGGTQTSVSRVSPAGTLDWGVNGIFLTNTGDFIGSPKVAGTSDGDVVVAWTQNGSTHVQRLNSAGLVQWAMDVVMVPAAGSYFASDLHGSGTDAILLIVHQTGSFSSPKHLVTQKLDAAGAAQWGATPLNVFDGGSLQFGNFPTFVVDGSGGAVFAWYGTAPLQTYAQHVTAAGVEAFPHNGSAGSTNLAQVRAAPSVCFDPVSGETTMFWEEASANQSMLGLSGQRFDAAGAALWGATGLTLIPVGAGEVRDVRTVMDSNGSFVFWTAIPSFGSDTMHGQHVDASGTTDVATFDVCSLPSGKARVDATLGTTGEVALVWTDERTDSGDLYAQNVNGDGSLGNSAVGNAYCFGDGTGANCPCFAFGATGEGCLNTSGSGATLSASGSASMANDTFQLVVAGVPGTKPGLIIRGNNQVAIPAGDGILCAAGQSQRSQVQVTSAGATTYADFNGASFGAVSSIGMPTNFQFWYRDPSNLCSGGGFNFTNAWTVTYTP